jgi:hypothetical protein
MFVVLQDKINLLDRCCLAACCCRSLLLRMLQSSVQFLHESGGDHKLDERDMYTVLVLTTKQ